MKSVYITQCGSNTIIMGDGSGIVTVGFCRSPDSGVGEGSTVGAPNRPKVRPYVRMIY